MSLSSIGSACSSSATLDSAGAKKKKSLLSADYKEAVNNKTKIEGIAISCRVKNKKGGSLFSIHAKSSQGLA